MATGDWTTIVNTTTSQFLRETEDNIMRQRKLLALMQSKGRVSYNEFGRDLVWRVKYKRAPLVAFADGDTITFSRKDRYKTATLDWRGYQLSDMMSKLDRLKNRSNAQIVDLYGDIAEDMMEDIEEQFGDELYIDGYATGNGRRMHGIESFFRTGTSPTVSGVIVLPNSGSKYATLDLRPGATGGNWSGTWPSGKGDANYDFWSPVIVDWMATAWGGGSQSWEKNCVDAMRYGITKARRSKSKRGMLDMYLLNDDLYRVFLGVYDAKEQLNVNRGGGQGLFALGFGDVMNFDGVDVTSEYGVPENTGYGFNTMQMTLRSMQPKLFAVTGPVYSEETMSYRFLIDFFGNCTFNPRAQVKLGAYTATGVLNS